MIESPAPASGIKPPGVDGACLFFGVSGAERLTRLLNLFRLHIVPSGNRQATPYRSVVLTEGLRGRSMGYGTGTSLGDRIADCNVVRFLRAFALLTAATSRDRGRTAMRRLILVLLALTCSIGSTICAVIAYAVRSNGPKIDEALSRIWDCRGGGNRGKGEFVLRNDSRSEIEIKLGGLG